MRRQRRIPLYALLMLSVARLQIKTLQVKYDTRVTLHTRVFPCSLMRLGLVVVFYSQSSGGGAVVVVVADAVAVAVAVVLVAVRL